jgi:hypothetical protein
LEGAEPPDLSRQGADEDVRASAGQEASGTGGGQRYTAGLSSREKQLFLYDVGHRLFWRKPVK